MMRNITKGREPKSLEEHRCSPGGNYENYADTQTLRESLVAEQRGLCCYCLTRIVAGSDKMKIEHWQSQSKFDGRQLDYSNLLAACKGNEGQRPKEQHCDTKKRSLTLSKNPANPAHDVELILEYLADGTVRSTDSEFDSQLNNVLNLNVARLRNNRKATLDLFRDSMPKRGSLSRNEIEKMLQQWNEGSGSDELMEYCQIVVYWLRKRLKRS